MKRLKTLMMLLVAALTTVTLYSCDIDDDNCPSFSLATVTLRPATEGRNWCMQLDDSTTLHAVNIASHPYNDKEQRAYIRFNDPKPIPESSQREYTVNVLTIDTILTKPMAPLLKSAEENVEEDINAKEYGSDPVEIVNSWETVAEDGYMNIRFRTRFGGGKHRVTLVHRTDASEPYVVEFFHDANGDLDGVVNDGIVAFRLDEAFNAGDKAIEITLKWNSYSGEKTAKFKYLPRKD